MERDESLAIRTVNHFRKVIDQLVTVHQGEVIQFYGDGCLIIFQSVVNAIRCSIDLQRSLKTAPQVPVRIGAHQGDVIIEGGHVFGSSVNIAARIESMSLPGAILLSSTVYQELKNQPNLQLKSLGRYSFKNVEIPIEIYAIAEPGFPVPQPADIEGKFARQNQQKSIGVLAFKNRSSDPEQDYFGEGIAEEIIYGLSQLENLKVASRSASFSFRESTLPVSEIANQLNIDHILEGSVRKMNNRVRITVQLVNASDGFQIWTERYDRELQDIFAIQDEIAEKVISKLKLTLLGNEKRSPIIGKKTENIEAYQLYLRGRSYIDQRINVDAALDCFQEATQLDPNFAAAYTSIAYAYFYKVIFGNYPPHKGFPMAEMAIAKALRLDSTLSEAHTLYGLVRFYYYHEWEIARHKYEQAILLQPRFADTYRVKAYFHSMLLEHEEAIAMAEKACEIEPLGYNNSFSLGDILFRARNYDTAISVFLQLTQKFPDNTMAEQMLASCYFMQGAIDAAKKIFDKYTEMPEYPGIYSSGRFLFAIHQGNIDLARAYLAHLQNCSTYEWVNPYLIALMYFSMDNQTRAEAAFKKAILDRDPGIIYVNVDPWWEPYIKNSMVWQCLVDLGLRH